ncbi:MAG: lytic transglycosylase domain-containing protein [Chloroherpetonaceae bacterium]|nr:lytic transglycosylase domain-containing protein [Chthonomonadaceae bacterium]MDW8208507.1 lytic transglycosylase domain-containing protein [Chloroherpetonaceae bacterium]
MILTRLPCALTLHVVLAVLSFLLIDAWPAFASTGSQYLALRRRSRCDLTLRPADVCANPFAYAGRVAELRGRITGKMEFDGQAMILLQLPQGNTVELSLPPAAAHVVRTLDLADARVLVRVVGVSSGTSPFAVLGIAPDSEVRVLEKQEQERRQAAERQRSATRSYRTALLPRPARGGVQRSTPAFTPEEVMRLAERYTPYLRPRAQGLFVPYFQFIARWNPRLRAEEVGNITYHLLHFADLHEVDPRLVVALVIAESNFNPDVTSRAGAAGLGQLMPGTARGLGLTNPYDPAQNLYGSIRYLRERLSSFGVGVATGGDFSFEQIALALAAYNAGPGAVKKHGGVPPYRETQAYIRKVISLYRQLNPDWRP